MPDDNLFRYTLCIHEVTVHVQIINTSVYSAFLIQSFRPTTLNWKLCIHAHMYVYVICDTSILIYFDEWVTGIRQLSRIC